VTGSGKTYSAAVVIQRVQRPAMVLAHNKTLAAQLYGEFREFFPHNAVEYFVSYYDYYQPEAYVPSSDTYIEKDASVNEHIEQMRLSATKALLERSDSIIVATVSSIYGLGDPQAYLAMVAAPEARDRLEQRQLLRRLADMQYTRNELDLTQGTYRVRGDVIDIFPAESEREAVRVELFDDTIDSITLFDPLTGAIARKVPRFTVYPGTHYVTPRERVVGAVDQIREDLRVRLKELRDAGRLLEAQRLEQRTRFDMEMMKEVGYCAGIENYSRYLSGRAPGSPRRACSTTCRATRCCSSMRATRPSRSSGPCTAGPLPQGGAGRVRFPAALGARQPAAEVRGVGAARAADDFHVGDARRLRGQALLAGGRATGASHRSGRSGSRSAPRRHAGG